jgi:transposase
MSHSPRIELTADAQSKLVDWIKAHGTPQQVVKRCRLILLMASGTPALQAAKTVGTNRHTAELWRDRFREHGPDTLWEIAPGRGRKPRAGLAARIVETTLQSKPRGQTHWSSRQLARRLDVHHSTVARVWQDHELKPHRHTTFKLSRDPNYTAKLIDVVGVYLSPPEHAVVLCVDEKSQIQALDRTQPGLPLKPGRSSSWTHDYVRNGTTTLFAALEVAKGKVTGQCYAKHRHHEFLKFLRHLDAEYDGGQDLHLILDNYGTHKHEKVRRWLGRHPRFKLHFIPTSSSWLNLVERWFAQLTNQAVRRGSFANVPDLVEAIFEFIAASNEEGRPFVWKATAEELLKKYERCRSRLEEISPGCTAPRRRRKTAKTV